MRWLALLLLGLAACGHRDPAPRDRTAPMPAAGSTVAGAPLAPAGSALPVGPIPAAGSAVTASPQLVTEIPGRPGGAGDAEAILGPTGWRCVHEPFAQATPLPEASGAAWWTLGGKPALVVIGDSGNDGAYAIVDPETGDTREQGTLPLGDGASDDLEGLAAHGGLLYGLTSSGWMRTWRRIGTSFQLVDGPYPIGPVDHALGGRGNRPPAGDGMVCDGKRINCGRNYEGLCLAAHPIAGCAGFVAAKADGHLYCIAEHHGRYAVDRTRAIAITRPGAMADCAFGDDDALWVGSNLFDLAKVYRVEGWRQPAHAHVVEVAPLAIGFPETIAARGDVVYRMSDTGGAPSLMAKFRCTPDAR